MGMENGLEDQAEPADSSGQDQWHQKTRMAEANRLCVQN
jgi:hypothetical protein